MLQKEHRLTDKRDFQKVFHHGQSFANRYLVLYYLKNRTSDQFRVGFSVSKKVGKAVTRNRVKRLLREAFRLDKERIKEPYDLVVIARPSAAELDFAEIRQNVQHLLRNMGKPESSSKRTPSGGTRRPDSKLTESNRKESDREKTVSRGTAAPDTSKEKRANDSRSHEVRANENTAIETPLIASETFSQVTMHHVDDQPSLTVSYDEEQTKDAHI